MAKAVYFWAERLGGLGTVVQRANQTLIHEVSGHFSTYTINSCILAGVFFRFIFACFHMMLLFLFRWYSGVTYSKHHSFLSSSTTPLTFVKDLEWVLKISTCVASVQASSWGWWASFGRHLFCTYFPLPAVSCPFVSSVQRRDNGRYRLRCWGKVLPMTAVTSYRQAFITIARFAMAQTDT